MVVTLPEENIPPDSLVRVEAIPGFDMVWQGVATESVSLNLDPGMYAYSIVRPDPPDSRTIFSKNGEFFVGVTPEQFKSLAAQRPKLAKVRMTSEGTVWLCGFPGCNRKTTSQLGAFAHEQMHYGVNLLKEGAVTTKVAEAAAKAGEMKDALNKERLVTRPK